MDTDNLPNEFNNVDSFFVMFKNGFFGETENVIEEDELYLMFKKKHEIELDQDILDLLMEELETTNGLVYNIIDGKVIIK